MTARTDVEPLSKGLLTPGAPVRIARLFPGDRAALFVRHYWLPRWELAAASLRGVSGWRVADAKEIEDDGRYYLEFSYKLDTAQLPRPMQIGLGGSQGWTLGVERTLTLNLETPSAPPPNKPQP